MSSARILCLIAITLIAPAAALAASPTTFKELVDYLVKIMNSAIGVLVTAALVVYFYGVLRHMWKREDVEGSQIRKFLLMGVIAIFVMVSIWGILEILKNTFEGRGALQGGENQGGTNQQFCDPSSFEDCVVTE